MDQNLFLVGLVTLQLGLTSELPWRRWSWQIPQEPIAHFFRRYNSDNIPVKSPEFKCQCPPSKECVVEFKINEDSVDFLKMRGVLKEEDVPNIKKEIDQIKSEDNKLVSRRSADIKECCCPPTNVMMPTFITEKQFNETLNRMKDDVK